MLLTEGPNGQTRYIHLGKELIAKTGSAAAHEDKPGYTGHIADKDLALTYMQQRYYDPVLGRFYSNDPVGFSASNTMMFNRYAYANNNPYKFTDPDGAYPSPTGLQNMHKWQEEARVKAGMSHREHAKAQLGLYGTAATLATPFAAAATGLRASATIIMSEASTALGIAEASLSNTPGIDLGREMIAKIGGDQLTKISSGISREFGDSSVDALSRTLDFTSESLKVGVDSLIKNTPNNKDALQGIQIYEVSGRLDAYNKRAGLEDK